MFEVIMEVQVEKIVHGGYGLARRKGSVCLIPFAVPGHVLDVEFSVEEEVAFGWIKKIIRPSVYRRRSLCPVFGHCGGCDFDNMDYRYELEVKKDMVVEDLHRIANSPGYNLEEVIFSEPYEYRNHAQFKVDGSGNIGFFAKKTHDVVPLPQEGCRILDARINDYVKSILRTTQWKKGGFRVRSNSRGEIYTKGIPGSDDNPVWKQDLHGFEFRIGIDDFFQVNNRITGKWLNLIQEYLQPSPGDRVADLFCGCGVISISVSKKLRYVFGVEMNRNAVKHAKFNALNNGIHNITFLRSDAFKGLKTLRQVNKIVVDPPRSGLDQDLVREICSMNPSVVVYASCDTATFARDVRSFAACGYTLRRLSLVDMFPRTKHCEVVAQLAASLNIAGKHSP
jgi:23S rRNA (uracil1939-C5)-methyltransferase